MTKEQAMTLDAQDLPLDAAQAYEEAITASEADFDTFMNLLETSVAFSTKLPEPERSRIIREALF